MTDPERPLAGQTVVVTGASSGIGRAAATELSRRGATLAVVGRDSHRTHEVAASIDGAQAFVADFASLDQVRSLATRLLGSYETIDVLANNAGGLESARRMTVDGHERTIQVNYLAPFLLTTALLPRLVASAAGGRSVRVISTASVAHRWGRLRLDDLDSERRPHLGGWQAYGSAKTAVLLFTRELARRTAGTGVSVFAFHPGLVATSFGARSALLRLGSVFGSGPLGIAPEAGAVPLVELASAADITTPSGTYFDGLVPGGRTSAAAQDDALARRLWALSETLI
ncbi:SDR family NAD(P)-dependent oxidoreductase [Agreia sp. COWG]|uniref:SDR family NAD(P)-dependent oxidoreductase n=1 Tax=Agreia sp. COWG TaxID=2773266 RepID=UPI0019266120|nr:SDR family NAD(P)-dependent oxidoreductase [Agreia sp. COWG]CAD6000626.1 Putative daunorubicin C-13 ketoreductase DnrU [Agreia sp. COWG]